MTTIDDLLPDPQNRRTHPDRNRAAIRASLQDVGAARSIVIDETNTVLAGNGVVEAARELGLPVRIVESAGDEVIAVRRSGLDPEQKRRLAMHDNRTAELAEWDVQQLTADRDAGLDLSPFFSDVELAHVLGVVLTTGRTDPDAVPDLRPTSVSPGDLFALGDHRLLCGDSTDPATVARLFADRDRAGMCFTSPPYADQRQYTGDAPDLAPERLARFLPSAAPFVDLFAVNLGIVRRSGFLVRYWDTYIAAAEAVGLGLLSWNVWSREGKQMSVGQLNAMFPIQHEWIFVFGRERQRLVPTVANKTGGRTSTIHDRDATGAMTRGVPIIKRPRRELGTVTTIPPVRSNGDHPAQFPIGLPLAYLSSVVGPVFDPFSGAGTTIIAAEQLARPCSAIEIAPRYIQVAIDRWEAFTGQAAEKLGTIVPE